MDRSPTSAPIERLQTVRSGAGRECAGYARYGSTPGPWLYESSFRSSHTPAASLQRSLPKLPTRIPSSRPSSQTAQADRSSQSPSTDPASDFGPHPATAARGLVIARLPTRAVSGIAPFFLTDTGDNALPQFDAGKHYPVADGSLRQVAFGNGEVIDAPDGAV